MTIHPQLGVPFHVDCPACFNFLKVFISSSADELAVIQDEGTNWRNNQKTRYDPSPPPSYRSYRHHPYRHSSSSNRNHSHDQSREREGGQHDRHHDRRNNKNNRDPYPSRRDRKPKPPPIPHPILKTIGHLYPSPTVEHVDGFLHPYCVFDGDEIKKISVEGMDEPRYQYWKEYVANAEPKKLTPGLKILATLEVLFKTVTAKVSQQNHSSVDESNSFDDDYEAIDPDTEVSEPLHEDEDLLDAAGEPDPELESS
jgi:hypothetical protein